jgi:serine phosphatase RsbU (regulator of sigma subunit)
VKKIIVFVLLSYYLEGAAQNISPSIASLLDSAKVKLFNQPIQSLDLAKKALDLAKKNEDTTRLLDAQEILGVALMNMGNYETCLNFFFNAIRIAEKNKDKTRLISLLNDIGKTYRYLRNADKALEYHLQALGLAKEAADEALQAKIMNQMGADYNLKKDYLNSEKYRVEALAITTKIDDVQEKTIALNGLGVVSSRQKKYPQALDYLFQSLKLNRQKANNQDLITATLDNIGDVYTFLGEYDKAWQYLNEGLQTAQAIKSKNRMQESYESLWQFYEKKKDFQKSLEVYKLFVNLKDSIFNTQKSQQVAQQQILYETEKKERENQLLRATQKAKDAQIRTQFILTIAIVCVLALVLGLLALFYRANNYKQRLNRELLHQKIEIEQKNEELSHNQEEIKAQRDFIEQKNRELENHNLQIKNSIQAALTIQKAILPHSQKMKDLLGEHFLIFRPRDVVSGDFYWVHQSADNQVVVVVADCTGHGVPGAFMTLIGSILINNLVKTDSHTSPAQILTNLHVEIRKLLKQKHTENNSGMDALVISLEKNLPNQTAKISYAGAKNRLYYAKVGTNQIQVLQETRKSIGGEQNEKITFNDQELVLPLGSCIYLGSDGYIDQNNFNRKRLGETRFKELLLMIQDLPINQQKEYLENALNTQMLDTMQRDDILLLGIRL